MNEQLKTSTRLPAPEPAFHADDTEQVAGYRTVSALAIVSLLFGLAAPLCFAWSLLMVIPLFGAVISLVAIRRIDTSDGALAGRWAATAGLLLCVASGTAVVSRNLATRYARTRQAEVFGRDWIELLLTGDKEKAFRMTVDASRRAPPVPNPGLPTPTKTPWELFLESPVVTQLADAGADSDIQFVDTLRYEQHPIRQFIIQQKFLVVLRNTAAATHAHPIEVLLTLQRSRLNRESQQRWLVSNFEVPPATDEAAHTP